MDKNKCPKSKSQKKSWKSIISSLSYFEIYIIDHINTFTSNRIIYNFIFYLMDVNHTIINPVYHENVIHVTNARELNEPQTFALAIQLDNIREPTTFKECRGYFYFVCYVLLCCFSFFILMGGIGVFLIN